MVGALRRRPIQPLSDHVGPIGCGCLFNVGSSRKLTSKQNAHASAQGWTYIRVHVSTNRKERLCVSENVSENIMNMLPKLFLFATKVVCLTGGGTPLASDVRTVWLCTRRPGRWVQMVRLLSLCPFWATSWPQCCRAPPTHLKPVTLRADTAVTIICDVVLGRTACARSWLSPVNPFCYLLGVMWLQLSQKCH